MPPLEIPDPLDTNALYEAFKAKIVELDAADPALEGNELELLQLCRALFAFHFNERV